MKRRATWSVSGVLIAVTAFLVLVHLHPGGILVGRAIDDLGQLVAAAVAAGAAAWRSRRSSPRAARSWLLLSAATGSWALGECAWSYFELLARRETPFPSIADIGYLLFPLLAAIALMIWPSETLRGAARWRATSGRCACSTATWAVSKPSTAFTATTSATTS